MHPTQISEWKQQLLLRGADVFGGPKPPSDSQDLKMLHAKIGQLTIENDFVVRRSAQQLPIGRQCQLLKLVRSTAYYHPKPVSPTQRWRDNAFVERFWHSLKYEEVYFMPTRPPAILSRG